MKGELDLLQLMVFNNCISCVEICSETAAKRTECVVDFD